ncbi:type IV secretory system conjugative DNA transfer family protein [Dyella psychrodurans]|uniref:Type IV secretory system conjugative DNA transfer family protein n=1 Tax=Dyella psychrodurans TaxID=1927960 RepID=A0A370WY33_9GAMM|nr:type IV secretory system conjugative DNA transfer family protein [Dyella psychrodurans]RDS81032.1 type IV secretory system conjugative DNA transfer family protein [Dyella psychrodurans]
MNKAKGLFATTLLLLTASAGLYLSGFLLLWLFGLRHVPLAWDTYWSYVKVMAMPDYAPYAGKIKLAGYVGFGLPWVGYFAVLYALFKPRQRSLHGNARFATRADLVKAGLLRKTPESVIIGKFGREYIYLNGLQHTIVTAPTRSGKTSSIAMPVSLTYQHSMVVMDMKGELYQAASSQRAEQGQATYKFAPYAEDGCTHRFNPLLCVSRDPRVRIGEIQTIGAILYPDDPNKDPFWIAQSRTAFLGFASLMYEHWDNLLHLDASSAGPDGASTAYPSRNPNIDPSFPSFERIYRLSCGDGQGGDLKEQIKQWLRDASFLSEQTRTPLSSLVGLAGETFSSVIATMQEPLQQFISPILAAATNASDFDVATLRRRPTTIFVVIPPAKLGESSKLLNIFFSTVVGQNLTVTPQEDKSIQHQLLLVLDEFTAMGAVRALSERISIIAGYWIRILTIIQSNSQLRSTYGPDAAQTYTTNHAASIVFTPREQQDAEDYSRAMGDTTVRRRNRSTGQGGTSYSYTEERRALMLPQELKELPNDDQIIFYEGCPPIRSKKNWHFKSPYFKKRIRPPVEVKPLALQVKKADVMKEDAVRAKDEEMLALLKGRHAT